MTGDYAEVLAAARKYAAGFRDFDLPTATYAIAGHLHCVYADTSAASVLRRRVRRAMAELAAEGVIAAYPRGEQLPEGGTSVYLEYRTPAPETVTDPEPWDDEQGSIQAHSERLAAALRDWCGLPAVAMPSLGADGARAGVWLDGPAAERVLTLLGDKT